MKVNFYEGFNIVFFLLDPSSARMSAPILRILHGQKLNSTEIPYRCDYCRLLGIMVRPSDGVIYNLDTSKYRIRDYTDRYVLTTKTRIFVMVTEIKDLESLVLPYFREKSSLKLFYKYRVNEGYCAEALNFVLSAPFISRTLRVIS